MRVKLFVLGLFLATAISAYSQAKPAAIGSQSKFAIGAGFSDFNSDWNGSYDGGTLWIDWNPSYGPSFLHGLGLEIEAGDHSFDKTGSVQHLRLDTLGGGPIYTIRHFSRFHPYAKLIMSYASFDFEPIPLKNGGIYSHDTRTDYAPGAGAEYRVARHLWVRGDYEYQFFVDFFHKHAMNPRGGTIGFSYDF